MKTWDWVIDNSYIYIKKKEKKIAINVDGNV